MGGSCSMSTSSSTFTVNGVSSTIYLGAALDGTVLGDAEKICLEANAVSLESSCGSGEFLAISVGRCLVCDMACAECTGPTSFDCEGSCVHGEKDSRGACPISADQVSFAGSVS